LFPSYQINVSRKINFKTHDEGLNEIKICKNNIIVAYNKKIEIYSKTEDSMDDFKLQDMIIPKTCIQWIQIYDQLIIYSINNTSICYHGISNGEMEFDKAIADVDFDDKYLLIGFEDFPNVLMYDILTKTLQPK